MIRKIIVGLAAFAAYFALAYCFKISYVQDAPYHNGTAIIPMIMTTDTSGVYRARAWVPDQVKHVVVYENGVSIGQASAIYNDPTRPWLADGKRWKFVVFRTKGGDAKRWVDFRDGD